MLSNRRSALAGLVLLIGAILGLGFLLLHQEPARDAATEIAILFPLTSDDSWEDFAAGVRLAAHELGLEVEERPKEYSTLVAMQPQPVLFRWYRERGSGGIRQRVRELADRPDPPLAIVGANNSSLTLALATELAKAANGEKGPILLMTTATADNLIDVNPDRSFRFGFSNGRQAKAVVDRLKRYYRDRGLVEPAVRALLVEVLDDPFAVDLAYRFERELSLQLPTHFVGPPTPIVRPEPFEPAIATPPAHAWALTTTTGDFRNPSDEEWRLARQFVEAMAAEPDDQWVVVLPVGTDAYRRFCLALHETLSESNDRERSQRIREHLAILCGDSIDYYAFQGSALSPAQTPAPTIFFEHVDPIDPTVGAETSSSIPARSLDREVARALLSVLGELGPSPTPAELANALTRYVPAGGRAPFFQDRERRQGGGAILVVPRPEADEFEVRLPIEWNKGPEDEG